MNDCIEASVKARDKNGYGRLRRNGQWMQAHRQAWIDANGSIPDGLEVMHTCDNPPCVNLAHLRLGTHAENMADMATKGRTRSGWDKRRMKGGSHAEPGTG